MLFDIIYKRTSNGSIQQWQAEINDENPSQHRSISGKVNGKLLVSGWKTAELMNEGRANQRTPEQQALFEVESTYKKKLEGIYRKDISEIDTKTFFECMLAKSYDKSDNDRILVNIPLGVYSQPKLDGMRCIATKDGLFSRNGKPIVSVPHIQEELIEFFKTHPNMVLDGELYNHEFKNDFNTIISSAKKTKPTPEDLEISKKHIEYHIYDCFVQDEPTLNFRSRLQFWPTGNYVKPVYTNRICSLTDIDSFFDKYLEDEYEGQMIRFNTAYEFKRTENLLKHKEFYTDEYVLKAIIEGKGNWAGMAKSFVFETADGQEFNTNAKGTMEFLKYVLNNQKEFLGTKCTVQYGRLTPDGKPRFGVVKEFNRTDV